MAERTERLEQIIELSTRGPGYSGLGGEGSIPVPLPPPAASASPPAKCRLALLHEGGSPLDVIGRCEAAVDRGLRRGKVALVGILDGFVHAQLDRIDRQRRVAADPA